MNFHDTVFTTVSHAELARYLLVIGPLDEHANAFLAWLGRDGGTVVTAGHVAGSHEQVTQPTTGISVGVDFWNPAVFGKDLAFSKLKSPEKGLAVARVNLGERLFITGFHERRPYVIPVIAEDIQEEKLIISQAQPGLARPGMSGSPIVNEQRQVVGVLVAPGNSALELVAELLLDIR